MALLPLSSMCVCVCVRVFVSVSPLPLCPPGFTRPVYNLLINATKYGTPPPAVSTYTLQISVLNTTFISPTPAGVICYLDSLCPLLIAPAYADLTTTLLLSVSVPWNVRASGPIALLNQTSPEVTMVANGTRMAVAWYPPAAMGIGSSGITLYARSPTHGNDSNTGSVGNIALAYPFLYAAGEWGPCEPDAPGIATRLLCL